jgi:hypothetical protein
MELAGTSYLYTIASLSITFAGFAALGLTVPPALLAVADEVIE